MVLQEAGKFSELAADVLQQRHSAHRQRRWRAGCAPSSKRGLIEIDDAEEAAGMLLGMVASAPQRAAMFGGMPLPSRSQIEARVRRCAALFLRGCQATR